MTTMSIKSNPGLIAMPDSVRVADLPDGYSAYLGYADGNEPTAGGIARRFPRANRVILTVTGGTIDCDGIDCEPGNVNAQQAAIWCRRKLDTDPHSMPIVYASVIGEPGYGMPEVINQLAYLHIGRDQVRLLSAHYGLGPHICGPRTCKAIPVDMDGAQWTDSYPGVSSYLVDMSLLVPDFFTRTTTSETEHIVQQLPVIRQGATGEAVRTAQGLLLARGYAIGVSGVLTAGIDGVFGKLTESAVRVLQHRAGLTVDGIVGPATWPVLLGVV